MSPALVPIAQLALAFARVNRATFHEDGVTPESDTDHTFMLGLLAEDIAARHPELGLDLGRLSRLARVHDLAEVYAGDTNTAGGLSAEDRAAKEERERLARIRLREEFGVDSPIVRMLEEYEAQACPESRFLKYLDKVTPKYTHALNGCAAIRAMGHDVAWLRERHRTQGAELATKFPEFAPVLGPIFDEACAVSEAALEGPPIARRRRSAVDDYNVYAATLLAAADPVAAVGDALEERDREIGELREALDDIGRFVGQPEGAEPEAIVEGVEKLDSNRSDAVVAFGHTQDENRRLRAERDHLRLLVRLYQRKHEAPDWTTDPADPTRMPPAVAFVSRLLGMAIEHEPDARNYLAWAWTDGAKSYPVRIEHGEGLAAEALAAKLQVDLERATDAGRHAGEVEGLRRAALLCRTEADRVEERMRAHPNAGSISRRNRSVRIHQLRETAAAIEALVVRPALGKRVEVAGG